MEGLSDVELCVDPGLSQPGKRLVDQGQGVTILLCQGVELAVVNTEP